MVTLVALVAVTVRMDELPGCTEAGFTVMVTEGPSVAGSNFAEPQPAIRNGSGRMTTLRGRTRRGKLQICIAGKVSSFVPHERTRVPDKCYGTSERPKVDKSLSITSEFRR